MFNKPFNFKKFGRSFYHAANGVTYLLTYEQNARIHAILAIIVGILAFILGVTRVEAAVLFMAVIMVFAIEIINTAVEKVFDVLHPEDHDTIRAVKDAMAGAVLISSVIALVVAILIFLPHIKNILGQ